MRLRRHRLHLLVIQPAVQRHGAAHAFARDQRPQVVALRPVADDVQMQHAAPQQGQRRLDRHIRALIGHQPPDEAAAQGQRAGLRCRQAEPRGVDGVFGQPYGLVVVAGRDFAERVFGPADDRAGRRQRCAPPRHRLIGPRT